MKLVEFVTALKLLGLPVAFSHFESDDNTPPPNLPFITYLTPSTANFMADNKVYHKVDNVDIELYTAKKDLVAEKLIEDMLDALELPYDASQSWIDSENVFQKLYEVRLI